MPTTKRPTKRQRITVTFDIDVVDGHLPKMVWIPVALRHQIERGITGAPAVVLKPRSQTIRSELSGIQELSRFLMARKRRA